MVKRRRLMKSQTSSNSNFESKPVSSAPVPLAILGQPYLIEGEDADAYYELLARIRATVNPTDPIDEMLVADVVAREWDLLRWRRLNSSLLHASVLRELEVFLRKSLPYERYSERLEHKLTKMLQLHRVEDEDARQLAQEYIQKACHAPEIFQAIGIPTGQLGKEEEAARNARAIELAQEYARALPASVAVVRDLLVSTGSSMDAVVAGALANRLDSIDRIDRLATIAESRRNAALREIERRRATLGQTLRRKVKEIEDAEFEQIEPTLEEGKNAA